jgi:hypothetical protein
MNFDLIQLTITPRWTVDRTSSMDELFYILELLCYKMPHKGINWPRTRLDAECGALLTYSVYDAVRHILHLQSKRASPRSLGIGECFALLRRQERERMKRTQNGRNRCFAPNPQCTQAARHIAGGQPFNKRPFQ